jgi:hypothetical protein
MGRGKDYSSVKDIFEHYLIHSCDDVMVLNKEYCESIQVPWGFVVACKAKIKSQAFDIDDVWGFKSSMRTEDRTALGDPGSPLPPQVANDPRKLKEHSRRESLKSGALDFDTLSTAETHATTATARYGAPSGRRLTASDNFDAPNTPKGAMDAIDKDDMQAAINQSQKMILAELRQMREHQQGQQDRVVDLEARVARNVDGIGNQLESAMGKVMSVIEDRLDATQRRQPMNRMYERGGAPNGSGLESPLSPV